MKQWEFKYIEYLVHPLTALKPWDVLISPYFLWKIKKSEINTK